MLPITLYRYNFPFVCYNIISLFPLLYHILTQQQPTISDTITQNTLDTDAKLNSITNDNLSCTTSMDLFFLILDYRASILHTSFTTDVTNYSLPIFFSMTPRSSILHFSLTHSLVSSTSKMNRVGLTKHTSRSITYNGILGFIHSQIVVISFSISIKLSFNFLKLTLMLPPLKRQSVFIFFSLYNIVEHQYIDTKSYVSQ